MYKGFLFSTSSSTFVICGLFDDSSSNRYEVISCSFDLHFSGDKQCCTFYSCALWPSVCLLWKNVYSGLLIFTIFFFFYWMSCLCIWDINPLSFISFANVFSHPVLPFHFANGALCYAKALKFNYVPFVHFCFCFLCLRRQIQKNLATVYIKEYSAYVFL